MKNMKKLVALFAATTMAMSLSVSAFAAPELSKGKDVLTFGAGDFVADQAQVTMMAYVVNQTGLTPETAPAYDAETMTMIALDQDTTIPNVKVDATKIAEGTTVVIKTSGSKGQVQTFVLEQAVTPTGKVVTFMNGADAVTLTSVDGKVTLPTDTAWNGGTPVAGKTFTLYSWVDENGNEYKLSEVTELTGIEAEVTLYAKYNTGIICGDVDFADGVDSTDSSYISFMAYYNENYLPDTLNQPIYEGSSILIGDVDCADGVDSTDASYIDFLAYYNENYLPETMGKTIYLINGTTVDAVYAD